MTKKKRGHPDVEEILARPWCYYCERDFDDLKILINHQKAKHFKCERCGRRLNTAGGLSVHMSQVHKENLSAVDNALPNRAGLDIEIFGMEGIPDDIVQQHTQRVLTNFHQAEAERRAATGNAVQGAPGAGGQAKKPKFESPSELKKRLAEHKAKLATEHGNGGSSGGGTPLGAGHGQPPAMSQQSPNAFQAGSPPYPSYQPPFNGPPGSVPFSPPQAFTQGSTQALPYQPSPAYGQLPSQPPPYQQPATGYPQPSYSPPPYPNQAPYTNQPFSPPLVQNGQPPFQGAPLTGPPRSFGINSPGQPFPPQNTVPPRIHTPPQQSTFPPRPPSLPAAPGLPQRPAFGAPQVNAFQMQQMHQGQIPPGLPNLPPVNQSFQKQDTSQQGAPQQSSVAAAPQDSAPPPESLHATSLDDLISGASREAEAGQAVQSEPAPAPTIPSPAPPTVEAAAEEKAPKKEKEKNKSSKLVYSDNDVSPEEKMARMPRYAFTPEKKAAMA